MSHAIASLRVPQSRAGELQDSVAGECSHAGEDIDFPTGGCLGFSVTLPAGFVASDQITRTGEDLSDVLPEGCQLERHANVGAERLPE